MTIRIFVGCAPNNSDLESMSVLEWSLRKHHPADDLSIEWMQLSKDPTSPWFSDPATKRGWNSTGWTTPFSAMRWAVPAVCNYEGKAIYTDSDMIAMADVAELWNQEFRDGFAAISKGSHERWCVTLFNNERMRKHVPNLAALKASPSMYRSLRSIPVQKFVGNWNCMDGPHGDLQNKSLSDPNIKMIHYTEIPTQLQLRHALPRLNKEGARHWFPKTHRPHPRADLQALFDSLLEEATANGYGPEKYRKEPFGEYRTRWAA